MKVQGATLIMKRMAMGKRKYSFIHLRNGIIEWICCIPYEKLAIFEWVVGIITKWKGTYVEYCLLMRKIIFLYLWAIKAQQATYLVKFSDSIWNCSSVIFITFEKKVHSFLGDFFKYSIMLFCSKFREVIN